MDEIVVFEYNVGDKVTLNNPNVLYRNSRFSWKSEDVENIINKKVYEIKGYGWILGKEGFRKYYTINDNFGDFIGRENRIDECDLDPVGNPSRSERNVNTKSPYGEEIDIGDDVYAGFFERHDPPVVRCPFCFVTFGEVKKILFYFDGKKERTEVAIARKFLCEMEDGRPYLDFRRKGNENVYDMRDVFKTVPETFASKCIFSISRDNYWIDRFFGQQLDFEFEFRAWLTHMGIYDEVKSGLMEKRKGKTNTTKGNKENEKDDKLLNILSELTPEEKERLKSMI